MNNLTLSPFDLYTSNLIYYLSAKVTRMAQKLHLVDFLKLLPPNSSFL